VPPLLHVVLLLLGLERLSLQHLQHLLVGLSACQQLQWRQQLLQGMSCPCGPPSCRQCRCLVNQSHAAHTPLYPLLRLQQHYLLVVPAAPAAAPMHCAWIAAAAVAAPCLLLSLKHA
jgi:hypothetical protein